MCTRGCTQLQYDMQSCIRGFIELLKEQERQHGKVALLGRKINQDSLESVFGRLRQVR